MNGADKLFGVVRKSAREEVRIALRTVQGRPGVEVRTFARGANGEKSQTSKGIVIDPGDLDAVITALTRARISTMESIEAEHID